MIIRAARGADTPGMSAILAGIVATSGSDRATDPDHMRKFYVEHVDKIACVVAEGEAGTLLGFQSLKRATKGNQYGVTPGWGIIGTYVSPRASGRGVGATLFQATVRAAVLAGVRDVDATIGRGNALGLGYYKAMGFVTYDRSEAGVIRKRYHLSGAL